MGTTSSTTTFSAFSASVESREKPRRAPRTAGRPRRRQSPSMPYSRSAARISAKAVSWSSSAATSAIAPCSQSGSQMDRRLQAAQASGVPSGGTHTGVVSPLDRPFVSNRLTQRNIELPGVLTFALTGEPPFEARRKALRPRYPLHGTRTLWSFVRPTDRNWLDVARWRVLQGLVQENSE